MNLKKAYLDRWIETVFVLRKPLLLIALLWGCSLALMLLSAAARADVRCNCAEIVDTCSATVNLDGMRVGIASDSRACARVDYLIDGQPFTALLVGGTAEVDWTGQPLHSPQVVVENCRVCADAVAPAITEAPAAKVDTVPDHADAKPMVKVMPVYPREALTNQIEGDVTLEFSIDESGRVGNIRVVESSNSVFVPESRDALSRFRYTPAQKDGRPVAVQKQRERFRFRMPDGINPVVSSNEA